MPKIPTAIIVPLTTTVDMLFPWPQLSATIDEITKDIDKPTILDKPIRRFQRLQNPSQKVHDILEEKAISLAEEMDWTEVQCLIADTEETESLKPRSLKKAKKWEDWNLWK